MLEILSSLRTYLCSKPYQFAGNESELCVCRNAIQKLLCGTSDVGSWWNLFSSFDANRTENILLVDSGRFQIDNRLSKRLDAISFIITITIIIIAVGCKRYPSEKKAENCQSEEGDYDYFLSNE